MVPIVEPIFWAPGKSSPVALQKSEVLHALSADVVAARGVGVSDAALKEAVTYSEIRKTFGKPICEHQAIQLKLGEMATRTEAARLLTYRAAEAFDSGERCDMEAGMAKYFATEAAMENSHESMRIHGA